MEGGKGGREGAGRQGGREGERESEAGKRGQGGMGPSKAG